MGEALTRYHISLDVADRPGVLAAVAGVFARHDVSIATVRQASRSRPTGRAGGDAELVIVTHVAPDAALAATVEELRGLDIVRSVASVLRVEGGSCASRRRVPRRGMASPACAGGPGSTRRCGRLGGSRRPAGAD